MKKLISTISIAVLGASSAIAHNVNEDHEDTQKNLSAVVNVGFESQYVFRGSAQGDESLQTSIDLSLPANEGELNFGAWSNNDLRGSSSSGAGINDDEIDLYLTYIHPLTEDLNMEVGYTYYWYPDAATGNITNSNEAFLGFSKEYYALWGATLYYDFDLEQTVFELSSGYTYSLEDLGLPKTSIDLNAYYGLVNTQEVNGNGNENGYGYAGANVDVIYKLNDITSVSVGARLATNNDDNGPANGAASAPDSEDSLWWGAALSMGF